MLAQRLLIGTLAGGLILAAPLRFDAAQLAKGEMPIVANTACADGGCSYDPSSFCGSISKSKNGS